MMSLDTAILGDPRSLSDCMEAMRKVILDNTKRNNTLGENCDATLMLI